MLRLLEGSKPVLALMEGDPFGGARPKLVRAMLYQYRFTTFDERPKTCNWWKREPRGIYFPPVGLRGDDELGASDELSAPFYCFGLAHSMV
jgi:hypothetical protein